MSKELTLLQAIYNEIRELKKEIECIDNKLLDLKILLLKEEEVREDERKGIESFLKDPEENFVTLES